MWTALQSALQIRGTNSNLEVDQLLGECAHFIVETEAIFANLVGCEDEVTLTFLGAVKDDLLLSAWRR